MNTFLAGWTTYWSCVGGRRGGWCWLGFAAASAVATALYEGMKVLFGGLLW